VVDDDAAGLRFCCALLRALRARGGVGYALLCGERDGSAGVPPAQRYAARVLREAGAHEVLVVVAAQLPSAALARAAEAPAGALLVALGPALAAHLQGLLCVQVSEHVRSEASVAPRLDVDLRLGGELEEVAARLGEWLGARLAARAQTA
jgi:hypothetical protein